MADLELDHGHSPARGVTLGGLEDGIGYRELVHQQILGRGSPTS
jgi:hypothetical protein